MAIHLGPSRGQLKSRTSVAMTLWVVVSIMLLLVWQSQLWSEARAIQDGSERLFTLLRAELKQGKREGARRDLHQLEELSAPHPALLYRLGKLLEEYRRLDEAEKEFEGAAAILASEHTPTLGELSLAHVYLQIAQLRFDRNDYWGAVEYFGKVGEIEPRLRAGALNLEGGALMGVGNLAEARAGLRQATRLDSSKAEYFAHLAWADLLAGDVDAASATVESAKTRWPQAAAVLQMATLVERERNPVRSHLPFSKAWHLKGSGFICCPCKVPCPCRSNGSSTYGHCEYAGAFLIVRGHYAQVSLDGLAFAIAGSDMGCRSAAPALYVGRAVTDDQLVALERIFQSFNPPQPYVFLRVQRGELTLASSLREETYEATLPGVLHLKIERQLDDRGEAKQRTAALDFLANTIEYVRNLVDKVSDDQAGFDWDYSGQQANFRIFDLDSGDYLSGRMLVQFADRTGFFNATQLRLIRELRLPVLSSYPQEIYEERPAID